MSDKHEKPCRNFCTDIGGPPDAPCIICGHPRQDHIFIRWRATETFFQYPPPKEEPSLKEQLKTDLAIYGNAFMYEEDDGTKRRLDPARVTMSVDSGKTKITVLPETEDVQEIREPADPKTYSIGVDWGVSREEKPEICSVCGEPYTGLFHCQSVKDIQEIEDARFLAAVDEAVKALGEE